MGEEQTGGKTEEVPDSQRRRINKNQKNKKTTNPRQDHSPPLCFGKAWRFGCHGNQPASKHCPLASSSQSLGGHRWKKDVWVHSSEIRPFITKAKAINLLVSFQKVGNQSDILSSTQVHLHSTINEQVLPAMRTSLQNLQLWTLLWSRLSSLHTTSSACRSRCCYTVGVIPSMVAGMFPPRLSECVFIVLSYEVVCFSWQVGGDLSYDTDPFCWWRSCVLATFKKPWGLVTRHFLLLTAWTSGTVDVGTSELFL